MQDIKLLVDGEVVYSNTQEEQTEQAELPLPVSASSNLNSNNGVVYVDDFRTPTDVDEQSAVEQAIAKAISTNSAVEFSAGDYVLKQLELPNWCNIYGKGRVTLKSALTGIDAVNNFIISNNESNFNTVGKWRKGQKFGNFIISAEAKESIFALNASINFSIGDLWFEGSKAEDIMNTAYSFGGRFGLLDFSNSIPVEAALRVGRFTTTNHFDHVYTGGQYSKYGVIVDRGCFSPSKLTLQSHTEKALWIKRNDRPCVIGDYYGEGNVNDITLGDRENSNLAVGVSILGGMTGSASVGANGFENVYAAIMLDYCLGLDINAGFRHATSAIKNGNKITTWPIAINYAQNVNIDEGYYFNIVNEGGNRKLYKDVVLMRSNATLNDVKVGDVDLNSVKADLSVSNKRP
jgi:hypothetical protein